jgi:hypothetical protein
MSSHHYPAGDSYHSNRPHVHSGSGWLRLMARLRQPMQLYEACVLSIAARNPVKGPPVHGGRARTMSRIDPVSGLAAKEKAGAASASAGPLEDDAAAYHGDGQAAATPSHTLESARRGRQTTCRECTDVDTLHQYLPLPISPCVGHDSLFQ